MTLIELFILAIGLSMDAMAVSICKGLSVPKAEKKHMLLVGLYFGSFQAMMPLLGYWLGVNFQTLVESVDHWIAFVLLGIIGLNMIKESRENDVEELDDGFSAKDMLPLAIATSIDALAVGITFAFLKVQIVPAVSFIGITTFCLSAVGLVIGNTLGAHSKSKAELAGGIVLIAMGTKILLEHTGIL
ncbi:MAG: manganese efflux pump [Oscillospiraceae bacterium]|nr:manganese efflux pump [Oscillospiraceae bacterium]